MSFHRPCSSPRRTNADSFPNGYHGHAPQKYQTQTAGASVHGAPTWTRGIRAAPGLGPTRIQRSDLSSLSFTAPVSDSSWFSSKLATTSGPFPSLPAASPPPPPPKLKSTRSSPPRVPLPLPPPSVRALPKRRQPALLVALETSLPPEVSVARSAAPLHCRARPSPEVSACSHALLLFRSIVALVVRGPRPRAAGGRGQG